MRTIATANQKGGSGKTTTAVSLGAALVEMGRRVLLLDLDPQASASSWLGVPDGGRGLLDVFTANAPLAPLVTPTVSGVDLIPASAWLLGVERAVAGEPGAEVILRRALDRLPPDRWDYALLDPPPGLGLLTVAALAAAGEVLVPVECSTLALGGLASLEQAMELVRDGLNPELRLAGILVCRMDSRTRLAREVLDRLRERFGPLVFKTAIPETVRAREAWSYAQPLTTYAPASPATEAYRAAARELDRRRPTP